MQKPRNSRKKYRGVRLLESSLSQRRVAGSSQCVTERRVARILMCHTAWYPKYGIAI